MRRVSALRAYSMGSGRWRVLMRSKGLLSELERVLLFAVLLLYFLLGLPLEQ